MQKLVLVKKQQNQDGYEMIHLETTDQIKPEELEDIIGVFRSKRQAKEFLILKAKEHSLCERLLGLENTKGECFAYRLGRCRGACSKKEKVIAYNLRFYEAFLKHQFQKWPFAGPILICEEDTFLDLKEYFLVDKWCLLGCYRSPQLKDKDLTGDFNFDLDTYKILSSYLKSAKNLKTIKPVKSFATLQFIDYNSQV